MTGNFLKSMASGRIGKGVSELLILLLVLVDDLNASCADRSNIAVQGCVVERDGYSWAERDVS